MASVAVIGEAAPTEEAKDAESFAAPLPPPPLSITASSIAVDHAKAAKTTAAAASKLPIRVFNEDLLCQHGELEPQKSVRRVVPNPVWEILHGYFPEAREIPEDAAPCPTCANQDREEQEAAVEVKRVAGELKRQLSDFLRGENRPDLRLIHDGMAANPMKRSGDTLHVIPRHFVTQLQNFVKSPATDNRPVSMSAILLLCPHKRMMYNLEAQIIIDSSVDLVWPQEYQVLERNVEADKRVVVR